MAFMLGMHVESWAGPATQLHKATIVHDSHPVRVCDFWMNCIPKRVRPVGARDLIYSGKTC